MRLTGFIGMLLVCGAVATQAQTTNNAVRPLSLKECIDRALEHNLDLKIERYAPELAQFALSGSYGVYDPVLGFAATRAYSDQPGSWDPHKENPNFPYLLDRDSFGPELSGRLPTGLSYDAKAKVDRLDAITDFNPVPTAGAHFPPTGIRRTNDYFATATITLKQPLLKNAWIDAERRQTWSNKKALKMSEAALRRRMMEVITQVQLTYFDLVAARERIKLEQKALELAELLVTQARKKVEVGELPPLEAKQAEAQVESVQTDLYFAQETYDVLQNSLKSLITDDVQAWLDATLEPTDSLTSVVEPYDKAESYYKAMTGRPDLLEARLDLERQDINLRYTRNQLFPNLDLVGSYGSTAIERNLRGAAGDIGDRDHPNYSYGVILSFPWSNRAARNNRKAAQATKEQALLRLKKIENDILIQVDSSVKAAESALKRVNSTMKARTFAELALEAETRKLQAGTSTSFVVLQLQRNLTAARTAEVRALVDHNKARAQLALNEGSTLAKHQLDLIAR